MSVWVVPPDLVLDQRQVLEDRLGIQPFLCQKIGVRCQVQRDRASKCWDRCMTWCNPSVRLRCICSGLVVNKFPQLAGLVQLAQPHCGALAPYFSHGTRVQDPGVWVALLRSPGLGRKSQESHRLQHPRGSAAHWFSSASISLVFQPRRSPPEDTATFRIPVTSEDLRSVKGQG